MKDESKKKKDVSCAAAETLELLRLFHITTLITDHQVED
jgi:hypothetical protein